MGFKITDGTGDGFDAGVNSRNEQLAHARIITHGADQSKNFGTAFLIATGFIPLTSTGVFSGIFYLKNTSPDENIYIDRLRTCGTMSQQWQLLKNPTLGTIVSDAIGADVGNANFTSSHTIVADAFKGGDAKTITDGSSLGQWINNNGHSVEEYNGLIILGPGDSIGLSVKPAVAGDACLSLLVTQEHN